MSDKRIETMANEKPVKAVLKMGIPVTMGMLFMIAYNLVDTYFIGLMHDDCQLAATNLAYPVMMIIIAIAGIVGNGGASYIARCIGAKQLKEANHTLTIGFEMILIGTVFLMVFGLICIDPLVTLLGAKSATFQYTKDYVCVLFWGSILTMGNYAIGQLLRAEGSTFYSMVGMIAGTIANIILDPIFIFTFGLEIKGAAIATVLGNGISVIFYMYYYMSQKTMLKPSLSLLHMDLNIVKEIMVVGIPHTLEQFFSTSAIIVNNNLAAGYGEQTVAAMGVANKIMSFGNYLYQGMAAGCQPLYGFNYGAKNYKRLKDIIKSSIYVVTVMEIGVMCIFAIFAPNFISIFSSSKEVISIGAKTLRAFMLMLPFVGTVSIVRNVFNSMGKAMFSFAITVVRQVVLYIPFLLIFNSIWGYDGLIHAQPVEEACCLVVSVLLLKAFLQREEKKRN